MTAPGYQIARGQRSRSRVAEARQERYRRTHRGLPGEAFEAALHDALKAGDDAYKAEQARRKRQRHER